MLSQSFKIVVVLSILLGACSSKKSTTDGSSESPITTGSVSRELDLKSVDSLGLEVATLAGGCFWKMDACYQQTKGVVSLAVGYGGGTTVNPTYEQVGTKKTGHAESIQLIFDPKIISYKEILDIFWHIHDPTQFDREGNDVGNDYRSAVFYHTERQQKIAERIKDSLDQSSTFKWAIVTEITPFLNFYKAEAYHQDYYNEHPYEPYTLNVVRPKVKHFEEEFKGKLKNL